MKKLYLSGLVFLLTGLIFSAGFASSFHEEIENLAAEEEYSRAIDRLQEHLEGKPDDNQARFWLARIYGWNGEYERGIEQYELLLEEEPRNYDYLLGKANIYYWKGQPEEALKLAAEVRQKVPEYRDAYELELRLLAALGKENEFEELLHKAQLKFEDFIVPPGPSQPSVPWNIKFNHRYTRLDSDFSDWSAQRLEISRHSEGLFLQLRGRLTERFDQTDRELGGEFGFLVADNWRGQIVGTVNPTGRILPDWSFATGGSYIGEAGRIFHFNFRRANYDGKEVDFINLTPELYLGNWRFFYSLTRADNEEGDLNFSHTAGFDFYYGERSYSGLGFYTGDEVESRPGGELLEMDVEGFYWRGEQKAGENWGVNYHFGYHSQGDQYNRGDYEIGVNYYF